MAISLPNKKDETVTIWSKFEKGADGPSRIIMVSDGRERWSMRTEAAYPCDPDDEDAEIWKNGEYYLWEGSAGVRINDLQKAMINLCLALREYAGFYLRPDVTPSDPLITADRENVIAKMKGNKLLIVDLVDSANDGEPIVSIRTNKALDPGEWMAALGSLAKAIDAYHREFE